MGSALQLGATNAAAATGMLTGYTLVRAHASCIVSATRVFDACCSPPCYFLCTVPSLPAGTKVEAIVRRLLLLLQLHPANKVIVFSSWLDVLDILSHALTANGIHHAFGRGRRGFLQALEQFKGCAAAAAELQEGAAAGQKPASRGMRQNQQQQGGKQQGGKRQREEEAGEAEQLEIDLSDDDDEEEDDPEEADEDCNAGASPAAGAAARPDAAAKSAAAASAGCTSRGRPRVLLMLVGHGAAGLNLTEAQHVLLVEPLLDPTQELQATGRISRFGQTATTHVHRWVWIGDGVCAAGVGVSGVVYLGCVAGACVLGEAGSAARCLVGGSLWHRKSWGCTGGMDSCCLLAAGSSEARLQCLVGPLQVMLWSANDCYLCPLATAPQPGSFLCIVTSAPYSIIIFCLPLLAPAALFFGMPCRFVVQHTVEENVARLSRQRAAAMDMSAVVAKRPGASSSEAADLNVADVAALLSSKWTEGSGGDAGFAAAADGEAADEGPVDLQD